MLLIECPRHVKLVELPLSFGSDVVSIFKSRFSSTQDDKSKYNLNQKQGSLTLSASLFKFSKKYVTKEINLLFFRPKCSKKMQQYSKASDK